MNKKELIGLKEDKKDLEVVCKELLCWVEFLRA